MAYTSSGDLGNGATYNLGNYQIRLTTSTDPEMDKPILVTYFHGPEGGALKRTNLEEGAKLVSWHVEATETEASVYARLQVNKNPVSASSDLLPDSVGQPIPITGGVLAEIEEHMYASIRYINIKEEITGVTMACQYQLETSSIKFIFASPIPVTVYLRHTSTAIHYNQYNQETHREDLEQITPLNVTNPTTHDGKTAYYLFHEVVHSSNVKSVSAPSVNGTITPDPIIPWVMLYGTLEYDDTDAEIDERLIATFPINLVDADGGPEGNWEGPGDTGDPNTTIHLTVIGALSGRHNDPLNDTSYSYTPADKSTIKPYGCGGDGGNGGGGGAGASTVVVRKFATDKASNKEILASAKRHGYGSGGGKGGTGGDGCILIYY